jgi:hypothetical protein
MKNKLLMVAGVLAVIGVLGKFYAKPAMAELRGMLVQDVDQPARAPLHVQVEATLTSGHQTVTIPKGYRLVVDFISMFGQAWDTSGNPTIMPSVVLRTTVEGGAEVIEELIPQQSTIVARQFYGSWPTTLYADTLTVGTGYAASTALEPSILDELVTISGHLVAINEHH